MDVDQVLGTGCWVLGTGCWVLGAGRWVLGTGCWVLGNGNWDIVCDFESHGFYLFSIAWINKFIFFPKFSNRLCKSLYKFSSFNDPVSYKFSRWSIVSSLDEIE
jgi:hypothetical protein